jgi:hypothetical protein
VNCAKPNDFDMPWRTWVQRGNEKMINPVPVALSRMIVTFSRVKPSEVRKACSWVTQKIPSEVSRKINNQGWGFSDIGFREIGIETKENNMLARFAWVSTGAAVTIGVTVPPRRGVIVVVLVSPTAPASAVPIIVVSLILETLILGVRDN